MFEGVIERKSHENGLLASFSGSSPALGSIMILQNSEDYVGKVDSVLCNADDPLIHIAHLDFKADINAMIGQRIIIRRREPEQRRGGRDGRGYDRDRRSSDRGSGYGNRGRNDRGSGNYRGDRNRGSRSGGSDRYRSRGSDDRRGSSDRSRNRSSSDSRGADRYGSRGSRGSDRRGGGQSRSRFGQERRGGDYRGKSGGARQSRDRDFDGGRQTAKSPWQKNKPTFEKKPAKTFRKAKGKKGGHAHNLGPKEIKP
ncbi:MAG: hypothetical protein ACPGAN_03830, partial [Candidatus Poseidoniaceae archaeon]